MDFAQFKAWIGRTETSADIPAASPLQGLAATLNHAQPPWPDRTVPPLGHWLYFLPQALQGEIAEDGHPRRGGFLPPVPLPRRMWAGSKIDFHAPFSIEKPLERTSRIAAVENRSGKSGELVFVTVEHEIFQQGSHVISESQDIVYREAPPAASAQAATARVQAGEGDRRQADWQRTVRPDPVLLFRFSALTFNGHRIHYDRPYAMEVEHYPGLVVHGPLTATLLMDLFLRNNPGADVASCIIRGQQPLFDTGDVRLCGAATPDGADLWALTPAGQTAMSVKVVVR
ncbi:FAS1-like dehydratase domain-containing protein [Herbaspirillum sp. B65]|uniref:FAS1-like dehydratase domain-containing protein n=1 Tax=Herbaspirillum sp. B65 TaxID=137708 RepID=UPI00034B5083|nr:MaoC family dehydratase N-terminal domain-containing protein [Herbaspirillum sp. B65]